MVVLSARPVSPGHSHYSDSGRLGGFPWRSLSKPPRGLWRRRAPRSSPQLRATARARWAADGKPRQVPRTGSCGCGGRRGPSGAAFCRLGVATWAKSQYKNRFNTKLTASIAVASRVPYLQHAAAARAKSGGGDSDRNP